MIVVNSERDARKLLLEMGLSFDKTEQAIIELSDYLKKYKSVRIVSYKSAGIILELDPQIRINSL